MRKVNIHEAKTHLSRLVEQASKGDSFIIAKAGKPMVIVMPIEAAAASKNGWLGAMAGEFHMPENFDQLDQEEIERLFGVRP